MENESKNRRHFVKQSSALLLGALAFPQLHLNKKVKTQYEPGVQLFTLMAVIDADTQGTLKQVADLGYSQIESAFSRQGGFYGRSAKDFKALVNDLGLHWRAHHVIGAPFRLPPDVELPTDENGNPIELPKMANLKENLNEIIDDVAEGGIDYLVCANIPTNTPEEVAEGRGDLDKVSRSLPKSRAAIGLS